METQDKDVMANIALVVGVLVLLAVVIFFIASLLSVIDANSTKGGEFYAEEKAALVDERIARVGGVNVGAVATGPVVRTSKEVVTSVCASCHGSGVLGAPRIGEAGDWASRLANGLDLLVKHGVEGLNAMPPKGGDATLTEDDIRQATILMLKDSGHDIADADAGAAAPAAEAEVAVVEQAAVTVTETVKDVSDAVVSGAATAGAAVVGMAGDAMAVVTNTVAAPQPAEVVAPAAAVSAERGKEIYKAACFSCHDNGVAGAPKTGDNAAWVARIATGKDALYATTINGKGAMPPKGGRIDLTDDEIKATVDYMISLSGG